MAGREVREYTNLSDPKDRKLGKGKDKIDEEDITFQRMVAKVSSPSIQPQGDQGNPSSSTRVSTTGDSEAHVEKKNAATGIKTAESHAYQREKDSPMEHTNTKADVKAETGVKSVLGLSYESSDDE